MKGAASLLLCYLATLARGADAACACLFDGNDADDCVVYGQLGDRVLIPWNKASQECLDVYKIKVESISSTLLRSMFPNADGTNGNVNSFVNWLKNDSGSQSNSIKIGYDQFWNDQNGVADLKDSISVDGPPIPCKPTTFDCYDAIKSYFSTEPGASEMEQIGQQLHSLQAVDKEKEQSVIRTRLCQEDATPECGALDDQVKMKMAEQPNKACSAFGLGPAEVPIPDCDGKSTGDKSGAVAPDPYYMSVPILLLFAASLPVLL